MSCRMSKRKYMGGGLTNTEKWLVSAGIGTGVGVISGSAPWGVAAGLGSRLLMKGGKHASVAEPYACEGGAKKRRKTSPKRSRRSGRHSKRSGSKRWIQGVVGSKKFKSGSFTRQAKAAGMGTKAFMRHVLAHPTRYSVTTRRRAQFLKNIQRSK